MIDDAVLEHRKKYGGPSPEDDTNSHIHWLREIHRSLQGIRKEVEIAEASRRDGLAALTAEVRALAYGITGAAAVASIAYVLSGFL